MFWKILLTMRKSLFGNIELYQSGHLWFLLSTITKSEWSGCSHFIFVTVGSDCFLNLFSRQAFPENAVSLLAYVTMNHMAVRKMVKKFEKVHSSGLESNFKSVFEGVM